MLGITPGLDDHWVSGSLKGLCVCHLHVSVALICSAYRAFACSLLFKALSVRYFAHIFCGTVCLHAIIAQLWCLDPFLAVVGRVDVFSVHRIAGSCGQRTFLVLTVVGFLF